MSEKFESYSDYMENVVNMKQKHEGEGEKYSYYRMKEKKGLEKLIKLVKKGNKLLKRAVKQQEKEKTRVEEEKSRGIKETFKEFGKAFCKAFCKALPVILTSLAGRVFNWIFKGKSNKRGLQFA